MAVVRHPGGLIGLVERVGELVVGEAAGENDTYGFALEAHPGKSQGRPVTPTGSCAQRTISACPTAFSQSPCPGTSRHPTTSASSSCSGSGTILMPVHHLTGRGLISLLGQAQARHIERALIRELGPSEMEKRRLVCGNAYSFQGDERNIIFLSMVSAVGDGHRIRALTSAKDQRRFNVAASRAKDQLWLFHSVEPSDLNPECVRAKLLDYCMHPMEDAFVQDTELSIEDLRRQASAGRRAGSQPQPFDSWFEVDVYLKLRDRGFRVAPQHEIAGYRIDLVVEGSQSRLAVECDGDQWHGAGQYEADMARQRQLERAGWTFWRVRGSEFYRDPDAALMELGRVLESHGIHPAGWCAPEESGHRETAEAFEAAVSEAESDRTAPETQPLASPPDEGAGDATSDDWPIPEAAPADDSPACGLSHPVSGRLPLGFVPRVDPYGVAEIEIDIEVSNLAEAPQSQLVEWLVEIVDREGPIHLDEAARRVARTLGIRRVGHVIKACLLYTSPSPRDRTRSRMPSSA